MSVAALAAVAEEEEAECGDHEWHFKYNRRLSCFAHSVSNLAFSLDGRYLVSGTGSGDVKVWDTVCWAEASKLKGCPREEPRALVISPGQNYLVSAYKRVLHIYQCRPPFRLEATMPAFIDPATKETSEWTCIAFSPMAEVDHPQGHTGQDNHLATISTAHLSILDYSGGWAPRGGEEVPRRTRSLMQSTGPTSLAYTACGWWIIAGFASGQLQIWNAFSLMLEKTLSAHTDMVNGVVTSPREANYESRFVSCGVDQTLRVWHSCGWVLEQHVHDTHCDRTGVRQCCFSSTGVWLISVSTEISVWRVLITQTGRLFLNLHQRLKACCGAEGLRTAAFCPNGDAIAVGSKDGVLGLWVKYAGMPPDPAVRENTPAAQSARGVAARYVPLVQAKETARPMQRVTAQGVQPQFRRQTRGEWFQRMHMRSLSMSSFGSRSTSLGSLEAGGRLALTADISRASGSAQEATPTLERASSKEAAMRWKSSSYVFDDERAHADFGDLGRLQAAAARRGSAPASGVSPEDHLSPVQKSMAHRCRGQVQRITLDPKVITDTG